MLVNNPFYPSISLDYEGQVMVGEGIINACYNWKLFRINSVRVEFEGINSADLVGRWLGIIAMK